MENNANNNGYISDVELLMHIVSSVAAANAKIQEIESGDGADDPKQQKRLAGLYSTVETLEIAALTILSKTKK